MLSFSQTIRKLKRLIIGLVAFFAVAGLLFSLVTVQAESKSEIEVRFDRLAVFAISHGIPAEFLYVDLVVEQNLLNSKTFQESTLDVSKPDMLKANLVREVGPLSLELVTKSDSSVDRLAGLTDVYIADVESRVVRTLTDWRTTAETNLATEQSSRDRLEQQIGSTDPDEVLLSQALEAELARVQVRVASLQGQVELADKALVDVAPADLVYFVGPRAVDQAGLLVRRVITFSTVLIAGVFLALGIVVLVWLTQAPSTNSN